MKKHILSALVTLLVLSCIFTMVACNYTLKPNDSMTLSALRESAELKLLYVSDVHYMSAENEVIDYQNDTFLTREIVEQKMNFLSEAITKTFADRVIESDATALLIGGDLTEQSSEVAHREFAAELARIERSGIDVWVIPGNHDIGFRNCVSYTPNTTTPLAEMNASKFAEIYRDFGYADTLRGESLDYAVDLDENYTLIAVENNLDENANEICDYIESESRTEWTKTQVKTAISNGKTPILMWHQPYGEVFSGLFNLAGARLSGGTFAKYAANHANELAAAGLEYVLSGHIHSNNVLRCDFDTDSDKNNDAAFLEIMSSALTSYDSSYRCLRFSENYLSCVTHRIGSLNRSYLPDYLTTDDYTKITTDFYGYSREFYAADMRTCLGPIVLDKLPDYIAQYVLGKNIETMTEAERDRVSSFTQNALLDLVEGPIYEAQAGGKNCVEKIAKKYGVTLPVVQYDSILDMVLLMLADSLSSGVREFAPDSDELTMVKYAIFALFASLNEYDLFGLMADYVDGVENVDSTPLFTELFSTGKLDLLSYKTLDNLLKLGVLSGINNVLVSSLLQNNATQIINLLSSGTIKLVSALLNGVAIEDYFECDPALVTDKSLGFNGKIYLERLFDEVVLPQVLEGIVFDDGCNARDFVVDRATLATASN